MMDSVSETRLAQVAPALAAKIRQMADLLSATGIYIRVVQGLRTWAEQDQLYAQGRTTPGEIVTETPGGYSYHNFGLAVDCVPSTAGPDDAYNPDWNSAHPDWRQMEAVGEQLGLDAGAEWHHADCPHFQLTGPFPEGEANDEVRQLFQSNGGNNFEVVWRAAGVA